MKRTLWYDCCWEEERMLLLRQNSLRHLKLVDNETLWFLLPHTNSYANKISITQWSTKGSEVKRRYQLLWKIQHGGPHAAVVAAPSSDFSNFHDRCIQDEIPAFMANDTYVGSVSLPRSLQTNSGGARIQVMHCDRRCHITHMMLTTMPTTLVPTMIGASIL